MSSGWGAEGNFDLKIIESFGRYVNAGENSLSHSSHFLLLHIGAESFLKSVPVILSSVVLSLKFVFILFFKNCEN